MLSKKEAAEKVKEVERLIEPLKNKSVTLAFGKHNFELVLLRVELLLSEQVAKHIKKRPNAVTGKNSTPQVMRFVTDSGNIDILLDDATFSAVFNGIRIDVGETVISLRKV